MQDLKINQIVTLTQADSPWLTELIGQTFTIVEIDTRLEDRIYITDATGATHEAYPTMGDTFEVA